MSVQPQWALEGTVSSSWETLTDIIHAASTDNIQAIAIMACERFGATLAICDTTCRKIEIDTVRIPPPFPLTFIAGFVGYSAGDCVTQLGKSMAGVRFLGLAAALVTLPIHVAAGVLSSLLEDSASNKAEVPSLRHTYDLLEAIEGRCLRAEFSREITTWRRIVFDQAEDYDISMMTDGRIRPPTLSHHPGIDGIKGMVEAFRQIHRLGDQNITGVTIKTGYYTTPWVIAFTKWCIGLPPSVTIDRGKPLIEQPGSKVDLIIHWIPNDEFEVQIHSHVPGLNVLVRSRSDEHVVGMTTIDKHVEWCMYDEVLLHAESTGVIDYLIPFGIHHVLKHLVVRGHAQTNTSGPKGARYVVAELPGQKLSPFPNGKAILEAAQYLLGRQLTPELQPLPDGQTVLDLPLSELYVRQLRKKCGCGDCGGNFVKSCDINKFLLYFSSFLGTILVTSLFENREGLLVTTDSWTELGSSSPFAAAIKSILVKNYQDTTCYVDDILHWARWMVRHKDDDKAYKDGWVMSCGKDQTLWLELYETRSLSGSGYLRLFCVPGKLHFQGDTYNLVTSECTFPRSYTSGSWKAGRQPISRFENLPELESRWAISPRGRTLKANFITTSPSFEEQKMNLCSSPYIALLTIADARSLGICHHALNTEPKAPDPFCEFVHPGCAFHGDIFGLSTDTDEVSVIATSGNADLRFTVLGLNNRNQTVMLRGSACPACALDACREAGIEYLVL